MTISGGPNTQISSLTGVLDVANGGTGVATIGANGILLGAGTSDITTLAPSTNGNVATSNGTIWTSAAAASTGIGVFGRGFEDTGSNTAIERPVFAGGSSLSGTETDHSTEINTAITIIRNVCTVASNNKDAASTVAFRDDAASIGALTVGGGLTGVFDSGVISVAVAAGSLINYLLDTTAGSIGNISVNIILTEYN